jgi:hypothetical protein
MIDDFPRKAVEHLAMCSCNCQLNAKDVEENRHYLSCMVGQAQKYLYVMQKTREISVKSKGK